MRAIKIEPVDIRITTEMLKTELQNLQLYLKSSIPLMKKVYGNDVELQEAIQYAEFQLSREVGELLEHPLLT